MRQIVAFFIDRSLLVNLLTGTVCLLGLVVASDMNRAFLPTIQTSVLTVEAELPGASPVDLERFVTFRIEEALQSLSGLDELTSTTTNGVAKIRAKFEPGYDGIDDALEQAKSRVDSIRHLLPRDLRPVRVTRNSVDLVEANRVAIVGIDPESLEHRKFVEKLDERLRRIPLIVRVDNSLPSLDLNIIFSRAKLDAREISLARAKGAVKAYLSYAPLGQIQEGDQTIAVKLSKGFEDLDDLRALPLVMNRAGYGVTLGQVAELRLGIRERTTRSTLNGKYTSKLSSFIDVGTDTIDASDAIAKVVQEARAEMPKGLELHIKGNLADIIEHELEILYSNGLGGIAIVVLVLMLFLGWRVALMTAIGIPFCYLGTLVALEAAGITLNIITLVAMILVIGLVVDDAIIVSERYSAERQDDPEASPREAAIRAVLCVGKPVIGMVATTVVVFAPLLFISGEMMDVLRPLPIVVIATLLWSLFESFFLLPNHLAHFMGPKMRVTERAFMKPLTRSYGKVLGLALKLRYLTLAGLVGLVSLSVYILMNHMELQLDGITISNSVSIYVRYDEADSLDALEEALQPVYDKIDALPPELVDSVQTVLGEADLGKTKFEGFEHAHIEVDVTGTLAEADMRIDEVRKLLLREFENLSGFDKLLVLDRQMSTGEQRDVISVYVSGGDKIPFQNLQESIRGALEPVEGVREIFVDESRFQRGLSFTPDLKRVLAYELDESEVLTQLREYFARDELLRIRHQGREIQVYSDVSDRPEIDSKALASIQVLTPRGITVPLSFLGRWSEGPVLKSIEHEEMLRSFKIDVLYDSEDVDADSVADRIEEKLAPVRAEYPGYYVSVKKSEYESKAKAYAIKLVVSCLCLVFFVLALSLNSMVQPLIVILAIPFGFIGVVLALYSHGMPMSMMAIVGVIGLVGVVVNDSLVMTTTINERRNAGEEAKAAVLGGAMSRFQAVLLTSLTTLGGVFPLAYGLGGKAGWIQPMVFALGWGLLFATLLTLIFLPCVLLILNDTQRGLRRLKALAPATPGRQAEGNAEEQA